ncbi:hypothetical protein ACP4OV_011666 [Aristida adscensionis]
MARLGKRKAQTQETPPATASPRSHATGAHLPRATAARSGECGDAAASVRVRRSSVAPCVTCGLCGGLLRDATTISECLHSCELPPTQPLPPFPLACAGDSAERRAAAVLD